MKKSINADHVVELKLYDWRLNGYQWSFHEEKRILGIRVRKEGFRCGCTYSLEMPETLFLKNGVTYQKPKVIISLIDGTWVVRRFDTYREAKSFAEGVEMRIPYVRV